MFNHVSPGRLASAIALCASLASSSASAQMAANALPDGSGFDLHLFRHALDSKGQFTVNGTDILGAGDPSFGLIVDWGRGLARRGSVLSAGQTVPSLDAPLVDNMFSGVFHANLGIANYLVVGLQLPVHLVDGPAYSGSDRTLGAIPGYSPQNGGLFFQGFGAFGLHAKLRLLRSERSNFGLALILQGSFPLQSAPQNLAGEPGVSLWPMLAGEWRPSRYFRMDLNLGYRLAFGTGAQLADPTGRNPTVTWGTPLTAGLGMSVRVGSALDLVAEVYGNSYSNNLFQPASTPLEAVGGLKIFVVGNSYLLLGAGRRITNADAGADLRAFIGFIFEPSIGDRDGDGYRDDVDRCPDAPEDFDHFEDSDGCPEPDNDQDGILDVNDQCVNTPEDRDGDHDEDGCPEEDRSDRDGDGILDRVDQCPDQPEDRDNFRDEDGCPDPDNDQDGILDREDQCPLDPEDHDNFEDEDGCPDPDNDHDRIPDTADQCPLQPETYNGNNDEDGCPDEGLAVINHGVVEILRPINFETNSARIREESIPIVEAVTATLRGNPQLTLVQVQGHADERGNDQRNLDLTRDRAASVMRALIERGIDATRLRATGFGERCPTVQGHNERAWSQNRRVVFVIVRNSEHLNEQSPVACPAGEDLVNMADFPAQ